MAEVIDSTAQEPQIYEDFYTEALFLILLAQTTLKKSLDELAVSYAINRPIIRWSLQQRIARASKRSWNTVADGDSFGITRTKRINRSMKVAFERAQKDIRRLNREISRIDRHIRHGDYGLLEGKYGDLSQLPKKQAKKLAVKKAIQVQNKKTKDFLQYHENRLSRTEAKSIWYENFVKDHGQDQVVWICASNPCPLCSPFCDKIYLRAGNTPMIPVHANCQCTLNIIKAKKND